MNIHLIRHGETRTSGKTYAGRSDVPLTERGRAQSREIAERLSRRPITLVLCSPLTRSIDTARPLAARLLHAPVPHPDLVEFDFGVLEGQPKGCLGLSLGRAHLHDPVPGGEALADAWVRAARLLAFVRTHPAAAAPGEVAIVGHYWINRLIHGQACGFSLEESCRSRRYRPRTASFETISLADTGPASPPMPAQGGQP